MPNEYTLTVKYVPPSAQDITYVGDPYLHAWSSVAGLRGARQTQIIHGGPNVFVFRSEKDEQAPLRVDDAFHFQVMRNRRATPFSLLMEAGHATAYAVPLLVLEDGEMLKRPLRIVALSAWADDREYAGAGELHVALSTNARPVFLAPRPKEDIVPPNMPYVTSVMQSEVDKIIALGNPEEYADLGTTVAASAQIMYRVRARFYATGFVNNVPGCLFFRFWNVHQTPSQTVLNAHLKYAIARQGMNEQMFTAEINDLLSAKPYSLRQAIALDALALGLSLACLSMVYVTDYAPKNYNGRARVVPVELFEDVLLRKEGDCEDFARLIAFLSWFLRERAPSMPLLGLAHRVLQFYTISACLMTVQGAKVGDGDNQEPTLLDTKHAGSHMQVTWVPRNKFLRMLRRLHPEAYLPAALVGTPEGEQQGEYRGPQGRPSDRIEEKMPAVQLEGTGNMFSLQAVGVHMDDRERAGMAMYVKGMSIAHDLLTGVAEGERPPRGLEHFKYRRMPEDVHDRTRLANHFYRQYRYLMPVGPDLPEMEVGGVRYNLASLDVGTTERLDGSAAKFDIGAPAFDLTHDSDTIALAAPRAFSDEAKTLFQRWSAHLAPAIPLEVAGQTPADVVAANRRLGEALGSAVNRLYAPSEPTRFLCHLTLRHRYVPHVDMAACARHLRESPHVLATYTYLEVIADGMYNHCVQVLVELQ